MANEATIRAQLTLKKGEIDYRSNPTVFLADVTGTKGPTPGAIACAVAPGTDVDLSELTTPGFCVLHNLDSTNYVTYGIWDPEGGKFYPLGELLAGEFTVVRLSRNIQEEYGTGTGTTGADTNRLRIVADTAACNVFVGAFEK